MTMSFEEWNVRGNLIGTNKKTNEQTFTWQPLGSPIYNYRKCS
jgi:hypothetical protein